MSYLDFEAIKASVTFEQALGLLQLEVKRSGNQWRLPCPACKGADRSLVVTEGKGAFCFTSHKGGDVIWLVSHVMGTDAKASAKLLHDSLKGTVPQAVTQASGAEGGFKPLDYLEHEHDAVKAIVFDTEFCKAHGIGYAGKGILRGTIAIPFRDEHGTLLGYIGVEDCKLPPSFTSNVIPLKKKA